jgi:hypothetical protein
MKEKDYLQDLIADLSGTEDIADQFFKSLNEQYAPENEKKEEIDDSDPIDKYMEKDRKSNKPQKATESSDDIDEQIIKFFRSNKSLTEEQVIKKARDLGIDPEDFKNKIYNLFCDYAKIGKHYHTPDDEFDPEELSAGTAIEKEHTNNIRIAHNIAKDHLSEVSDYYTKLKKYVED